MKTRQETIPGTGLPLVPFLVLLAGSVALFLGYGGLLWRAPREASHVMRFVVSYLAVIPFGALLLLGLGRWSWPHLVTTTGAVWSFKMVITAVLFQFVARGTATQLQAVAPPTSAISGQGAEPRADYHSSGSGSFTAGSLRGYVRRSGKAVAGAVVFVDAPAPGRAAAPGQHVDLEIAAARYAEPLYLAHVDDAVRLVNHDGTLHTAHFSGAGRLPPTRPMPPAAGPLPVSFPEPGVFRVRCDNHPGEGTWLVVVDHPYATRTAADGSFSLDGVPAGEVRLIAVAVESLAAHRARAHAVVRSAETVEIDVDLDSAQEI